MDEFDEVWREVMEENTACAKCGKICQHCDHLFAHIVMRHDGLYKTGEKRLIETTEHGRKVYEILCRHGFWVPLYDFTNTCDFQGEATLYKSGPCDYNFAGQFLAPRSHWGEETGETAGDIY